MTLLDTSFDLEISPRMMDLNVETRKIILIQEESRQLGSSGRAMVDRRDPWTLGIRSRQSRDYFDRCCNTILRSSFV